MSTSIKTWRERYQEDANCKPYGVAGEIQEYMQAEINDLRAALAYSEQKYDELNLQYISDFGQLQEQEPVAVFDVMVNDELFAGYLTHPHNMKGRLKSGDKLYTTPVTISKAWSDGYRQGAIDERTSEDNIGIAGFGAKVNPARQNPYGIKE